MATATRLTLDEFLALDREQVSGAPILPGFNLDLEELFSVLAMDS